MKRVLVTGAAGFTGNMLARMLSADGWEVIPLDRVACGLENEVVIDFCDRRFTDTLRALPKVDAVAHLGTKVGWDGGTRADLFRPNVLAVAELADWAAEQDAYFVFASAALIAGERTTHITADCGLNTENDYLYGKWLAEENIKMSGVRHANLRISGIFGHGGPTHLGLNRAIDGALKGIPPVRYGDGNIKRNYIYVKDLGAAIKYCLDNEIEGTHLTGGSEINTIAEMLDIICEKLHPGLKPDIKPDDGGGHDQVVDPSPALPKTRSFAEAISDISRHAGTRKKSPPRHEDTKIHQTRTACL